MAECKVAVVDHHPVLLEGLASLVRRTPELVLTATGSLIEHIRGIAASQHPDVMILDLNVPGDVLRAISHSRKVAPAMKILVFADFADVDLALQLLESGISGYVLKSTSAGELHAAIDATRRGEMYVSPPLTTRFIDALRRRASEKQPPPAPSFTARESQIVRLLERGKRNREIAKALSLSEKTVKSYMTLLMQKLNVRNRLEAVIATRRLHLDVTETEPRLAVRSRSRHRSTDAFASRK